MIDAPIKEVGGFAHEGLGAPKTKWKDDTNEDEGFLVVRFEGSQWLTLSVSHLDSKGKEGWLEITGTKGTLVFDAQTATVHRVRQRLRQARRLKSWGREGRFPGVVR